MPLVTTTEMFRKAYDGGYAIGAFNVNNMEIIQGITEAAKEENAPLILQVSAGARKYAKHAYLVKLVEAALEDTDLPIALHLDHGADFEICKSCVDGGFTSVMIDGSKLPFEENIALTKKVVEYAHAHDVVVEAEIGHVASNFNKNDTEALYTSAEEASEFVTASECDSLAISIGTAHGVYKAKAIPEISFTALAQIRNVVNTPLVLHGGSGSGDDNLRRCAREGICKVNVYTDLYLAAMAAAQKSGATDYLSLRKALKQGMSDCLKHYYSVFETKPVTEF